MVSRLIAFFGPDGSGKSTQVELLANRLKSRQVKVKKIWIRSPHTIAYLSSLFLIKIGYYRIVSNPSGKQLKLPAVSNSRSFRYIWPIVETVGVLPLILLRVYIPLFLGYTVIAERYVVDTVVTIAYYIHDIDFVRSRIAKFLLSFMPRNSILIHLDSDYSTIAKRRGAKTEPSDFIEFQRMGYQIIGRRIGVKPIDTSRSTVEQVSKQIMPVLEASGTLSTKNTRVKSYIKID